MSANTNLPPAPTLGEIGRDNWPADWEKPAGEATAQELIYCAFNLNPDGTRRHDETIEH